MTRKTIQERITLTLQLRDALRQYMDMESWTPVMGAMLLAGIRPEAGCIALPKDGGVSLDGVVIKGSANRHFSDARWILKAWHVRCEDDQHFPTEVSPLSFIAWCIEDQVQEEYATLSPFVWIDVFKSFVGLVSQSDFIDFEVAEHAEKSAEPLGTILDKLDDLGRKVSQAGRQKHVSQTLVRLDAGEVKLVNTHRAHLTTAEVAAALNVEPESIQKAHSKNGNYCGVAPTKLPNRRLAWPIDSVERMTSGTSGRVDRVR